MDSVLAQGEAAAAGLPEFNRQDLQTTGSLAKVIGFVLSDPRCLWFYGLLRNLWPIPSARGWAMVTRFDDVQEVLKHDKVFEVPFGPNVEALNDGPNFLLGMSKGPDYDNVYRDIVAAFRREDVAQVVAPLSHSFTVDKLASCSGRIDAVRELITWVPSMISEAYYGVTIPDKYEFADWTIAMSTFMFGNPSDRPDYRRIALAGAARLQRLIDDSIAKARLEIDGPRDDVLMRLVRQQRQGDGTPTDKVIRAYMIGMITGFVPTNTMAAGHMLEMLLRRPDFMQQARAAAIAGDDDLLRRCLFEAMRFMPLNPGPFRICVQDYTIARGTRRAATIKAGTKLLVGTKSAMFDGRRLKRPMSFDPDRPRDNYMLFGHGLHWCVGAYIAEAQITQTFKVLLAKRNLRRASGKTGILQEFGPFPSGLTVEFDP